MFVIWILEALLGVGFLIFVHELGHFTVAKLSKVTVEKFSLGFGPELAGFTKGETRYSLRIIPLGGYVKMLGDEPGSEGAKDSKSFLAQGFLVKAAIVVAGSVMNVITALVLFVAVFRFGISFPAARVGGVDPGLPAFHAGLEVGDRIVSIEGKGDMDFATVYTEVALSDPGKPLEIVIERDGSEIAKTVYPTVNPASGSGAIGIDPYQTLEITQFFAVESEERPDGSETARVESPALVAGLKIGDKVLAMNGEPVASFYELRSRLTGNGLKTFTLTVSRRGSEKEFEVSPIRSPLPLLGIAPQITTSIVSVEEKTLAARMGLKEGDQIVRLGETEVSNAWELSRQITENLLDLPPLVVERAGVVSETEWTERPRSAASFLGGVETSILPAAAHVMEGTAAEHIGMQPGDELLSIDGREVKAWPDIRRFLHESTGDSIEVSWKRGTETMTASFEPVFEGFGGKVELTKRRLGFTAACRVGVQKAWDFAAQIYTLLKKAVTGQASITKNLGGPVTIAYSSYAMAREGFANLLFFLAIIGVNLGVVNLLPIPILDGGALVVFLIEKIKGSPLGLTTQVMLQYVGLAIIVSLFLFVTFNDIVRLVGR